MDTASRLPSYHLAFAFQSQRESAQAYARATDALFADVGQTDLSIFHFACEGVWLVALVGIKPSQELEQRFVEILSKKGVQLELPDQLLVVLQTLRGEAAVHGSLTERAHRPPLLISFPDSE